MEAGLIASAGTPARFSACQPQTLKQANVLTYSENGTPFQASDVFLTRVNPSVPGQANGQSEALVQNVAGGIYNSESGFTLAIPGSAPAGLADFGTRIKAVFRNVPLGVRLFVSLTNVLIDPSSGMAAGEAPRYPAIDATHPFAQLVSSETGVFSVAAPSAQAPGTNIHIVEITPLPGTTTATAVWKVVNPQFFFSSGLFQFAVYVSYASVAAGVGTVNLSFTPTGNVTAIPRFADTSTAAPAINIASCGSAVTLTASPNPAVYGQPVILNAAVPVGATGTVSFLEDPATLLQTAAGATWAALLPTGSHSIYAAYSGDVTFSASTSNHIVVTVQKAATTAAITSSLNRQPGLRRSQRSLRAAELRPGPFGSTTGRRRSGRPNSCS